MAAVTLATERQALAEAKQLFGKAQKEAQPSTSYSANLTVNQKLLDPCSKIFNDKSRWSASTQTVINKVFWLRDDRDMRDYETRCSDTIKAIEQHIPPPRSKWYGWLPFCC